MKATPRALADSLHDDAAAGAVPRSTAPEVRSTPPPSPGQRPAVPRSPAPSARSMLPPAALPQPTDDDALLELQAQLQELKRSGPDMTPRQSRAQLIAQARLAGARKQVAHRNMYL